MEQISYKTSKKSLLYGCLYAIVCLILLFTFIGIQKTYHTLSEKKVYDWFVSIINDDKNHRIQVNFTHENMEILVDFELFIDKEKEKLVYRFPDEEYQTLINFPESINEMSMLLNEQGISEFILENKGNTDDQDLLLAFIDEYIVDLKVNSSLLFVDKMSFQLQVMWMNELFDIKISEIIEKI